ncbi:S-adenosyl-L-methionine-dependent methyltransferase [Daldinia vernicosa]|uniref:S-adenosyl-L-methionine-dependent methyltransferase n=1 Tax=Daldinia vernicosa TaxID=114800 RepID=UPI0020086E74|nr:S-adenosyl-L-methionine-dependent methyltransferase [Daldinia vernicosa]KAI0846067.1 S-adenosyl-L-methionine-dependent methyltransferase [Daldinia vernicosa]
MFNFRGNARYTFNPRSIFYRPPTTALARRALASKSPLKYLDKSAITASGPVAEELAATGLWIPRSPRGKSDKASQPQPNGDKTRVNVVSENLCDNIISYVGKSLSRHVGCDLIDIYPGAGLWSHKLHDFLKPRSHILMEPDVELYKPFLKPLLDQPNTMLVPASGIIWRELNSILTPEYLPHQTIPDAAKLSQRNDTLLVTANIAFHPQKRFLSFASMANLVLYQYIEAIRNSGLFQRYGLVRMLIWTRHDDKYGILPKLMQKRKKLALDTELCCEWVHEVCGREGSDSSWYVRDNVIDESSNIATWKRMKDAKIRMPKGRSSEALKEARLNARSGKKLMLAERAPVFKRSYRNVLHELEERYIAETFGPDSDDFKSMRNYQWRANWEKKKHQRMFDVIKRYDAITTLYRSGKAAPEKIEALERELQVDIENSPKGFVNEFVTYKDNLHYFRQDPPLLHWDRRAYEPLRIEPEEFFPNIECSLLDIQPKGVHPLLRQTGPGSNRAGDCFELILSSMMSHSTIPISQALDALMPGAADYIIPRWKSARDLRHGGVTNKIKGLELTPRMLNARQWEELIELWMEWPFRPEFHELVARTHNELAIEDNILASE